MLRSHHPNKKMLGNSVTSKALEIIFLNFNQKTFHIKILAKNCSMYSITTIEYLLKKFFFKLLQLKSQFWLPNYTLWVKELKIVCLFRLWKLGFQEIELEAHFHLIIVESFVIFQNFGS